MSTIKGKVREQLEERVKQVGLVEVNVVSINPTMKEWEEDLGFNLKDDQEEFDYTGESKDGNPYVRVDIWLKEDKEEKERWRGVPSVRFLRSFAKIISSARAMASSYRPDETVVKTATRAAKTPRMPNISGV